LVAKVVEEKSSLSIDDVTFRYPGRWWRGRSSPILERFSWTAPGGRTVLLGPNGAGKTTLLSVLATLLRPEGGTIRLGELTDRTNLTRYRREIAFMPQRFRPIPGFSAVEQVAYIGWLRGGARPDAQRAARTALDQVGLRAEGDTPVDRLSGGQQRRVGLAQLLVRPASARLLDEPTVGLDPAQRARFRELIVGLPSDGPTIVSTHQVDDLGDLFDTVVVFDRGKVRFEGTPVEFLAHAAPNSARPAESAYAALIEPEA
jgi:ABC-2 type transport system ATP-binding protein